MSVGGSGVLVEVDEGVAEGATGVFVGVFDGGTGVLEGV